MSIFTIIALSVISQWPGAWTVNEINDAAVTIFAETESSYIVGMVGDWSCISVEGYPNAQPTCLKNVTKDEIISAQASALFEVLNAQGRIN